MSISIKVILGVFFFIYKAKLCESHVWGKIKCDLDADTEIMEGQAPLSKFPWLGVIQHSFYMAKKMRFAVTSGVLIHPGYVMAPAQDISRIPFDSIENSTVFIAWGSAGEKYAIQAYDAILHPDFRKVTYATIALVQLNAWAYSHSIAPVTPICLPYKGMGSFDNLYIAKMSDRDNIIQKEIYKAFYVVNTDCAEFYYRAQMNYDKMAPRNALCATAASENTTCVWDGGTLLITKMNNAYWTLLGFGMRGPGCGAPTRFEQIHTLMPWITEVVNKGPLYDLPKDHTAFFLRQLSPYSLELFKADIPVPSNYGQCDSFSRGGIIYKDQSEILANQNIARGFYFVSVHHMASFKCATINFKTLARSKLSVWVEHHCNKDVTGLAPGMEGPDIRRMECFLFFKSVAYVEFRFTFSFKALVTLTMYGVKDVKTGPLPFVAYAPTDPWYPTNERLRYGVFYATYIGYYA